MNLDTDADAYQLATRGTAAQTSHVSSKAMRWEERDSNNEGKLPSGQLKMLLTSARAS